MHTLEEPHIEEQPGATVRLIAWLHRHTDAKAIVLTLFLLSGWLKGDPRLAWLPVDLTVLTLAAVVILLCVDFGLYRAKPSLNLYLILALFISTLPALLSTGATHYAGEKVRNFYTLTLFAALAPPLLLRWKEDLGRFLTTLAFVSTLLGIEAALSMLGSHSVSLLRINAAGSNTIALGRAVGTVILWLMFCWMSERLRTRYALPLLAFLSVMLVASGSRGPLIATALGLVILLVAYPPSMRRLKHLALATVVVVGLVILSISFLPSMSITRITSFFSGEMGESGGSRMVYWQEGLQKSLENPQGLGWGGFAVHFGVFGGAVREYPHNMLVEVFLEGGWLAGFCFLGLILFALQRALLYARRRSPAERAIFVLLIFFLFNALASGDLNDNRLFFCFLGLALAFPFTAQESVDG